MSMEFADGTLVPSIKCPQCHKVSYAPGDIEHRYCGNCHQFHKYMGERPMRTPLSRQAHNYRIAYVVLALIGLTCMIVAPVGKAPWPTFTFGSIGFICSLFALRKSNRA